MQTDREPNRNEIIADRLEQMADKIAVIVIGTSRWQRALELIATPMRPDGTWNRDREACRQLAQQALDGEKSVPV